MITLSLPRSRSLISRRQMMAVGGLSLLGLPDLLRGQASASLANTARPSTFGKAKSCVIVFLKGGPSQLDTFDMKPHAPAEIRGEFSPIPTNVSGIQICEHLPNLARQADKYTIVRSMVLSGDAAHSTAAYEMTTGHKFPRSGEAVSTRADHPHFGAVVAAASGRDVPAPPYVMLPDYLVVNGEHRGGQYAGLLGSRFDPFTSGGDPNSAGFGSVDLGLALQVEASRLDDRVRLLRNLEAAFHGLDREPAATATDAFRDKALGILRQRRARDAFNLEAEPAARRDRYGRTMFGQSVLLARRLIEAGVRLVQVNCMSSILELDRNWDTHKNNFATQKDLLLPRMDPAVAALFADLAATGLLDETLVLVMGEFGRTPRINPDAGRDHWPNCFSLLMGGAGIPGGHVYGASDAQAAYPTSSPLTPGQLAATVFHALGIDPATTLTAFDGRPYKICEDAPVLGLWG